MIYSGRIDKDDPLFEDVSPMRFDGVVFITDTFGADVETFGQRLKESPVFKNHSLVVLHPIGDNLDKTFEDLASSNPHIIKLFEMPSLGEQQQSASKSNLLANNFDMVAL